MIRQTLTDFAAKADAEIALFSLVETATLTANIGLGNAADARVAVVQATYDENFAKLVADHKVAIDKLTADNAAVVAKAADDLKAAVDPLNAQVADMTAANKTLTDAATAQDAAVKDANQKIADLTASVATLTGQLAGKAGQYQVTTTPLQEVALRIAAATAGVSEAEWVNTNLGSVLSGLVTSNQQTLLELALAKFPTLPATQQGGILALFGSPTLIAAPLDEQLAALRDFGLKRFLALPPEGQDAVGAMILAAGA
jgi:hypothetical protein